jgi:hypothetical protein
LSRACIPEDWAFSTSLWRQPATNVRDKENFDNVMRERRTPNQPCRLLSATHSVQGWWAVFEDGKVVINTTQLQKFKATYAALQGNLRLS